LRRARDAQTKEERRKTARVQEIENSIARLEKRLGELGALLEHAPADPTEVTRLGQEYARVQDEMDGKLGEWERLTLA
jgi:hypothetical protein